MDVVLRRSPQLLGRDPESLSEMSQFLSLQFGEENTQKILGRFPQILNYSQQNIFESVNQLEITFDGRQITNLLVGIPQVLAYKDLDGRLHKLSEILNMQIDDVKELVLKQPTILSISTDLIQKKCEKLQQVCELEGKWKLQRTEWSSTEIGRSLTCSLERMDRLKFLHNSMSDEIRNERSCLSWLIMSELEFHKYYQMAGK
eukprot:TRINITY_DN8634_c0_g1_i1.p2 TRINITY_DN8634_c0_g1~~TRINITY_DN8634_c0_g1_i1.p2  ORF type:complete len:202 (+),score=17.91 TRINITY_DN8634_c0_g1_i1:289-894(+)